MPLSDDNLDDLVRLLSTKPGHETVRVQIARALIDGLGVSPADITQEVRIEARSRVDTLLGDALFELKSDLEREDADARNQLTRYLREREAETGRRFTGIATDGLDFSVYEMRNDELYQINEYRITPDIPRDFLVWLESVVSASPELPTDVHTVARELGSESAAYARVYGVLSEVWQRVSNHPDANLKRQLWNEFLAQIYGDSQDTDDLWFQHTYLTIVAKAFAFRVLGIVPQDSNDLLEGNSLSELGILGAIESDFFDWVNSDPIGAQLIEKLVTRISRFRVAEIDTDVLKVLYESLIDPEQRHDLGEYFTPDWLAERICSHSIDSPLNQRVLDPACGSGTFIFHAVRAFTRAATDSGQPIDRIAEECTDRVFGMDIHPVAIIISRVTYLLALGTEILVARNTDISIPVYFGDALQRNVNQFLGREDIEIRVPAADLDGHPTYIRFPVDIAEDPNLFDAIIAALLSHSQRGAQAGDVRAALDALGELSQDNLATILTAYDELTRLNAAGRDHVWGYVARNIARPFWLSRPEQKVDRLIGNPPWLSFRYMHGEMQTQLRERMQALDIWVGGRVATHQDLSAYFFVRCVQLYLSQDGTVSFLMPLAAMTRGQFEKFRSGQIVGCNLHFLEAWVFDERVFPLFPVPACALFATRSEEAQRIPNRVLGFAGLLDQRNCSWEEASQRLVIADEDSPGEADFQAATPYRNAFHQGATLTPRMTAYIERRRAGAVGAGARCPVVSRRSAQEKEPWRDLPSIRGAVEPEFIRPALLGESIAPYRILGLPEAIVPFRDEMLDSDGAAAIGSTGLADWLRRSERIWSANSESGLSLSDQYNYYGKLEAQFPLSPLRVLFAASGRNPAAAILESEDAVIEHALYWHAVENRDHAQYLIAILNSETARQAVSRIQARGQWGARHFDKVMFTLPIPRYSGRDQLHIDLAQAAAEAEDVAQNIEIPEEIYFITVRRMVRDALREEGVANEIDQLVSRLLFGEVR